MLKLKEKVKSATGESESWKVKSATQMEEKVKVKQPTCMESWCANRQRSSESTTGGTLYVSSYGAVYSPFLGAGLQYWRRFVEMAARSEVAVVGGELPWHNLWSKEI